MLRSTYLPVRAPKGVASPTSTLICFNEGLKACKERKRLDVSAVIGAKSDTTGRLSDQTTLLARHHAHETPSQAQKMANRSLEASQLFPKSHIVTNDPLFYLYFPFGAVVAGVRMLMWLSLLLVDQAWLTNNDLSIAALQAMLGVDVRWTNTESLPSKRHVIVSNHVTTGDMMALYRLPKRTVHIISSQLPNRIAKTRNHRIDFRHASVDSYDRIKGESSDSPIHLFPEGGMTDGTGMMKFNKGFMRFSDRVPVVPVALRAELPWSICTHTLNSSFLSNLFWFCFSPYVRLDLTVLPAMQRKEGESKAKFVERIQQNIAKELQIPIFDFSLQAKKQLMQSGRKTRR